jgi:uncharacterized protein YoxC
MRGSDKSESLDAQLNNLRSTISDLGYQVDSFKTKTAAALGLGVFSLLLAGGAAYDLVAAKSGVWLTLGVAREDLVWIAGGLGAIAFVLLVIGFLRVKRSDGSVKTRLEQMEQEYAELVEQRDAAVDAVQRLNK